MLSILQLEGLWQKASARRDAGLIKDLEHELGFRKTPAGKNLHERLRATFDEGCPAQVTEDRSADSAKDRSPKSSGQNHASRASVRPSGRGRSRARQLPTPTTEQTAAIAAFMQGGSLKINAFTGSGKTSTLQMLAHATSKRGQYIAFNGAIVADAKAKFPARVNCSTIHGLAFKATSTAFKTSRDKMTGRMNAHKLIEFLDLKLNWRIDSERILKPLSQAAIILKTLHNYTQSADQAPLPIHVPRIGSLITAAPQTITALEGFAVKAAKHLWQRMLVPNDPVPLGFDGFPKMWALSEPLILADFILVDEAQDINPVVLNVLESQASQMVYVGDRYQQIYEWRGTINAMEIIRTDTALCLTRSFRFGKAIADAASRLLELMGETEQIRGNPDIDSRIGVNQPRCILCRTNAATISSIIEALDRNQLPHFVGNNRELMDMLRGVQDLKRGEPSTVADFFGFQNWDEVVAFARSEEGNHLLTFVNLVESRGERQLMWALCRTVKEKDCDIVVSTAHKAKGREWDKVRLTDDFLTSRLRKPSDDSATVHDPAELRLFYVAMTRARRELQITPSLLSALGIIASD